MPKYEGSNYRCKDCGDFYHTKAARDHCEATHKQ